MGLIFEQGSFDKCAYRKFEYMSISNLNDANKTKVFISHKHEDLEDLKGVIGFLEQKYNIKAYIDSEDDKMPYRTSGETANIIKRRINECDKFILLATNAAIESKWCNWELGYGDAQKYMNHIALFPMKPQGTADTDYKGSEYMCIYPYVYCEYNDYYVSFPDGKKIGLKSWLNKTY